MKENARIRQEMGETDNAYSTEKNKNHYLEGKNDEHQYRLVQ